MTGRREVGQRTSADDLIVERIFAKDAQRLPMFPGFGCRVVARRRGKFCLVLPELPRKTARLISFDL